VYLLLVVHHFKTFLCVSAASGLLFVSGCGHVQPWEREGLAALDAHQELEASGSGYDAHFWNVREGAAGGTGEAGGGCGCN